MFPSRAYVALGSNQQQPLQQLQQALMALQALETTTLVAVSSFYRTKPVQVVGIQDDFINAVVELRTQLLPHALLDRLLKVEVQQGRVRQSGMLGLARTLDLDLLLYDDLVLREIGFELPHPRLAERAFVVYPLQEIAPTLCLPDGRSVASLCAACSADGVQRLPSYA